MILALAATISVVVGVVISSGDGSDQRIVVERVSRDTPSDILVEIPSGYGAKDAASRPALLPDQLSVTVGEVIRIINNDRQTHFVGPYVVAAGETIEQRFVRAGSLTSTCSVHPSGQLSLVVNPQI